MLRKHAQNALKRWKMTFDENDFMQKTKSFETLAISKANEKPQTLETLILIKLNQRKARIMEDKRLLFAQITLIM